MPAPPNPTAMNAWYYLYHLRITTEWELMDLMTVDSRANEFSAFEVEIKLLHNGVSSILTAVAIPLHHIVAFGLRVNDESWDNPPATSASGLEEVRVIMDAIAELVYHEDRRNIEVPGFGEMIDEQFRHLNWFSREALEDLWNDEQASDATQTSGDERFNDIDGLGLGDEESDQEDLVEDAHSSSDEEIIDVARFLDLEEGQALEHDPLAGVRGAREGMINELTTKIAKTGDGGLICAICLDIIVTGEKLRILPCSHSFHMHCIDSWLRRNATCPNDRSRVFGLGAVQD